MNKEIFMYHLHSDYSSCITNIDSVTKVDMYIEKAKEYNMTALAFSEHGCVLNWYEKKIKIESAGMKYVHATEIYITETLDEKIRDNYHCILIAKNYEGFLEINRLTSRAFDRKDNHFYYVPRVHIDDIISTSDNIIITTACLGGILAKGNENIKSKYLDFLIQNKHRCYLEVQHHNVNMQIDYNKFLYETHKKTGIPKIAPTHTHSLNHELAEARLILQKSKHISFKEEDEWDLTFQNYDSLIKAYEKQNSIPMESAIEALNNTKQVENQIETFEIDMTPKFPKLYDNPNKLFRDMIYKSIDEHPYALQRHSREKIEARVEEELEVYIETNMVDFMLFQKMIRDWERKNDIYCGAGRGSINGSFIAYLLGITEMDSIKFNLNFFRFANKFRVSNPDIDTDYYEKDRDKVREFILNYPKIVSSEIVSYGTIALRGAIRDVGRALEIPLDDVGKICSSILIDDDKSDYVPDKVRNNYPELFKYVDVLQGVITSVGTHPAGVLCATRPIHEEIGTFTTGSNEYPISALDMYGLDACWWTKMDFLGLDNVGIINETCKLANIEKINPDNIDLNDWEVWKDIREDTSLIFQMESGLASQTVKSLFSDKVIQKIQRENPDISYLKLFSFANALIRPCGSSIREKAITGCINKSGVEDIDKLLAAELGFCLIQEDIMLFLMNFCGYNLSDADFARKCIAKKKGTEQLLPKIKEGFYEHSQERYSLTNSECESIIDPILQCILDATRYAFSWNHSDAYSFIGYACGYLRHYYPIEFITTCLNIWQDKEEKTSLVVSFARKKGVTIKEAKFRYSRSSYFFDENTKAIYKGMHSIKYLNESCSEMLYCFRDIKYDTFVDLLFSIPNTTVTLRHIEILILLDFFIEFGNAKELMKIYNIFVFFKKGKAKSFKKEKLISNEIIYSIVKRFSKDNDKTFSNIDSMKCMYELEEYIRTQNIEDFSYREKIATQQDYLGYVNLCTGLEEDRPKLIVLSKYVMISKKGKNEGKPWAVVLKTRSIGSGKETSFTVAYSKYNEEPVGLGDIIYADKYKLERSYWHLLSYHTIV